jgi:hypothetical protein
VLYRTHTQRGDPRDFFAEQSQHEDFLQNKAGGRLFAEQSHGGISCKTRPTEEISQNKPNGVFSFDFNNVPSRPACLAQIHPL